MTSASNIAKYIVQFFHEREDLITNLKLQKLLYYVQGWYLGLYNKPAFSEPLQAWVHGPVQPGVYAEYKDCRWNPIDIAVEVPLINISLKQHIDEVLAVYGVETAYALERMTHQENPWQLARNGLAPDALSTAEITWESMKIFFAQLANEND